MVLHNSSASNAPNRPPALLCLCPAFSRLTVRAACRRNASPALEGARPYTLQAQSELRFFVASGSMARVMLTEGAAESFGIELQSQRIYTLTESNVAIFTWQGCTLQLVGVDEADAYCETDTSMVSYVNVHAELEKQRADAADRARAAAGAGAAAADAARDASFGPRVLIAGPTDAGKSSLSTVLLAYAARLGHTPTFIDLDVGQGSIALPGTIAATPLDRRSLDVAQGVCKDEVPLVYFYGHASPGDNPELFKACVERLSAVVRQREEFSAAARTAGVVVNTCGWVDGLGYELLLHSIEALRIDKILVIGSDRLHAQLKSTLAQRAQGDRPAPSLLKLPRSGGAVTRDSATRRRARARRVREYFYGKGAGGSTVGGSAQEGSGALTLSPSEELLKFDKVNVWRCTKTKSHTTNAMLPMGQGSVIDPLRLEKLDLGTEAAATELSNAVLAVLHVPPDAVAASKDFGATNNRALLETNCAGFVHVKAIDNEAETITVLAPCAGDLPSEHFLIGSISWVES